MTALTRTLIAALFAGLLMVGLAAAQTETPPAAPEPEPTEFVPACDDPVRLSGQVAELYLTLFDLRERLEAGETAALGDLYAVAQHYETFALECGYLPEDAELLVMNTTDVDRILDVLDTLSGDPLRGQLLYDGQEPTAAGDTLGCSGCHTPGLVAPLTEGTWTRWDEVHRLEERFADYDFTRYAVESIVLPWEYFVEGYPEYTMPDFYAEQLSYQDLADLIIYLESQDQLP